MLEQEESVPIDFRHSPTPDQFPTAHLNHAANLPNSNTLVTNLPKMSESSGSCFRKNGQAQSRPREFPINTQRLWQPQFDIKWGVTSDRLITSASRLTRRSSASARLNRNSREATRTLSLPSVIRIRLAATTSG